MVRRYELTDAQWERIAPLLPQRKRTGRPRREDRQVINAILWRLRTGAPWRDLPARYGPHQTVSGRYNRWAAQGVWTRVLQALHGELHATGRIDETFYVDTTTVRASRAAAGAGKKGGLPSPATMPSVEAGVG